jgi:hypothetical protein
MKIGSNEEGSIIGYCGKFVFDELLRLQTQPKGMVQE